MRVRAGRSETTGGGRRKFRAVSVFFAVLLVGMSPLYSAALKTPDGWTIDTETAVEYREVTGDELNRTPWPNDTVYVFRNYGELLDFETDDLVSVPIVANGSVFTVDFYYNHSANLTIRVQGMLPENTTLEDPIEPLNWSATVQVHHYHGKDPDGNWTWWGGRAFNPGDGFYAVGRGPDGQRVRVLQNQTGFMLDDDVDDKDLVSVIDPECESPTSGDGGGDGGDTKLKTASGGNVGLSARSIRPVPWVPDPSMRYSRSMV